MAILNPSHATRSNRPWNSVLPWRVLAVSAALFSIGPLAMGQATPAREYQVKAVFLFNFAQFVEWPPDTFTDAQAPLVIGILGDDPFEGLLKEAVRDETVGGRPLVVQNYSRAEDIRNCHVLFISRSEAGHLSQILTRLRGRGILTVGEMEDFARRGGMIQLITDKNKVRLRINVEAAKACELTISSKILRAATIVTAGSD